MSKVIEISEDNFESEVLKSELPVLVDFWAAWCGPCMMLGPIVEEAASEVSGVKVVKLNVDNAVSTAQKYNVVSIPTLILFDGGKEAKRSVGLISKEQVLDLLK